MNVERDLRKDSLDLSITIRISCLMSEDVGLNDPSCQFLVTMFRIVRPSKPALQKFCSTVNI